VSPVRSVVTATGQYDVVGGDRLRVQALVLLPVLDPTLSAGIGNRLVAAQPKDPHVGAHITDSILVLTGRPELALPRLSTADELLHVTLRAAGLPAQDVQVTVPMGSALPYKAPAVALAVPPVVVSGRVSQAVFPHAGIANAMVTVSGAAPAGQLLALRCPLGLAHAVGTVVRVTTLAIVASTTLAEPAAVGDQTITVASTASITAGTVLGLGPVGTCEHIVVDSVEPVRQTVFLRAPVVRSRPPGAVVSVSSAGVPSSPTTLGATSLAGDGVIVTAAAVSAQVVEVADAVPDHTEYRLVGVPTDADGYWRVDGVRAIAALQLTVGAAGFTTSGPTAYPLDFSRDPNVIDVELT
jgi:hypothetical protein